MAGGCGINKPRPFLGEPKSQVRAVLSYDNDPGTGGGVSRLARLDDPLFIWCFFSHQQSQSIQTSGMPYGSWDRRIKLA
jgi:hypothetical protein